MQTIHHKAQISRQEVSDDMGKDTNLDNSYPENASDSEHDWDNDDTRSVYVEPPSRSHSPLPQSPTSSFSTVDDQAFDDEPSFQPPNLMTYPEGKTLNEQGIIDWSHNYNTKSSQWRSEQSPETEKFTHTVAFLDPNMTSTQTSTESPS